MHTLARGQRLPLDPSQATAIKAGITLTGIDADVACFALDAQGKLVSESYMTFFNQPSSPCGAVQVATVDGDAHGFALALAQLPATVDKVVVTASCDSGTMAQLHSGHLRLVDAAGEFARISFSGADFVREKAVMLGEFYRRDGAWRFLAIGQGFDGGLDALVRHFGGEVAGGDAGSTSASASASAAAKVNLEKRVEREAPQLVSLVKSAGVSLVKAGLGEHRARVCLVLDISASMSALYRKGLVQKFAERILALGCKFDDDGAIDVFLFGERVHHLAPMDLSNWTNYVQQAIERHPLEGDTRYGRALEAVRRHYFPDAGGGERSAPHKGALPVYVMFVTDGSTSDKPLTERQLRWASREPIFWQFMGIGKGRKSKAKALAMFADSDFPFLEKLDELDGRLVDNADFFAVPSPDSHSDTALYDLLMTEYPGWLRLARQHGLLD